MLQRGTKWWNTKEKYSKPNLKMPQKGCSINDITCIWGWRGVSIFPLYIHTCSCHLTRRIGVGAPLPITVMLHMNVNEMMDPSLKMSESNISFMYMWCVQPPLLKTRRYSFSRLHMLDRRTAVAHESLGGTDGTLPFVSTLHKKHFCKVKSGERQYMF